MKFLDAICLIKKRKEFKLCDNIEEQHGLYPSICVYKNHEFVGKLRWPFAGQPATVDKGLIKALKEK